MQIHSHSGSYTRRHVCGLGKQALAITLLYFFFVYLFIPLDVMDASSSSSDGKGMVATPPCKRAKPKDFSGTKCAVTMKNIIEGAAADMIDESSGPVHQLNMMKEERRLAKKAQQEKTKEVKAFARRVQRLQSRAAKLTDDGLLVEYARRQAAKRARAQKDATSKPPEEE